MSLLDKPDNEIIDLALPLVESMESGWDNDNYFVFTKSFSDSMKNIITEENYNNQRKHIFPILGKHKCLELLILHRNTDNVTIIWKMYCEKREEPILLMCSFKDENNRISISSAIINY